MAITKKRVEGRPCMVCQSEDQEKFFTLGMHPHCNKFLAEEELHRAEPYYPINLWYCRNCSLVQHGEFAPPEEMFTEHPYQSGTTRTLREHFTDLATSVSKRFGVTPADLVVDVGSNDGTFLDGFRKNDARVLGVDPAHNIAALAHAKGIETLVDFFGERVGKQISRTHGKARVVTAAGVFFHVPNLHDFVRGVDALLTDDGVFVVQALYLRDIVENTAFDQIYHEHVCYYTLRPLTVLFARFGMEVFDVERSPIHGGSIIVYARRKGASVGGAVSPNVSRVLEEERAAGFHDIETYRAFSRRIEKLREDLRAMLLGLKREGKTIAAFGAPAKGNTLLNYCQIGPDILDYATEANPMKIGRYTPGTRIQVISDQEAMQDPPDYFLLLPWNFKEEILARNEQFRKNGGKFIVPVPWPEII